MSTTIDQRVVEMRFDNKQFEQNCSHTMSTLDKLKQKLNLTGASKGLQEVDSAAKRINMGGLASSVEAVSAKFSAMQVIGTTALVNITNQAMATGKKMISALTVDPIKTGFQEYETQINAVQTILANTSSKGTDIHQVNKALEELNKYADMTIYNFTEMTRNIGTFTAAGVDLDTSVAAIKGIANLAAVSGSTSQQASTAMYQLSQALASGTVKLQDWNSVVNAGMGGEVFQNALKRTAKVMGTDVDALIEKYGSFRESLTRGNWLTTEILTETLNQFTMAAEEGSATWNEYKKSLKEKGYTDEQVSEILKMANTATDAATKVKTFTQLWDVLKEAAQSGWSQSWKLIIGDFEEAKSLLTPLADFLTNAINTMSDARNRLIEGALGITFSNLAEKLKGILDPVKKSADSIKSVVKSVEEYAAVVDDIIGGSWGTGQERWNKLTEAGYDWAHAQNLVNEKLGSSVRHTSDYTAEVNKSADTIEEASDATSAWTKEEKARIDMLARMSTQVSDEYMIQLGYTKEQIEAFRELAYTADKLGLSVKDLLDNIDEIDGRWLLMNSFKNIGMSIVNVFKAIAKAWRDVFPAMQSEQLFNIIAGFHKFTTYLEVNKDTSEKITKTFRGLFAIIDLITTLVSGGLKIAFKLITSVLSHFNLNILDVTAYVGDAIYKFNEWVDSLFDVSGVLDVIVPFIVKTASAFKEWFIAFKNRPKVQEWIQGIINEFKDLKNLNFTDIGYNIVEGFRIGIGEGIKRVITNIVSIGKEIIDVFCAILGIRSPSRVFMAIGGFIIAGLVLGIKEGLITVPGALQDIVDKCLAVIKNIDWSAVFAIGVTIVALSFIRKIGNALESFAAPFEGLGDLFEETSKLVKSFGKVTKAVAFNIKTKALKNLAISLVLIAAAVAALTFIDPLKLWNAVGVVTVLAGVLIGLAWATGKMSDASVKIGKGGVNIDGLKSSLLTIGLAVLALAVVAKIIGSMNALEIVKGFVGLAAIMAAMVGFIWASKVVTSGGNIKNVTKLSSLLTQLAISMLLMVGVVKLAGSLSLSEMAKGALFAAGFLVFVESLGKISKKGHKHAKNLGSMVLKIAVAMALMVLVIKLIDKLEPEQMLKGTLFAAAFTIFIKALVKVTQVGKKSKIAKLGGLLLAVSLSMALMVGVCKLIGLLSVTDILKSVAFVAGFVLFIKALISVTKIGSKEKIANVSVTILAVSIAVGILAAISVMLSLMSVEALAKGVTVVSILCSMVALMLSQLKGAEKATGTLIALTVAIAVLAIVVAGLSMIKPEKLVAPVAAMVLLMSAFSVMIGMTKFAKSTKTMRKMLLQMVLVIALLGAIVAALSFIPNPEKAVTAALAVSTLLLTLSAALFVMGKTGKISSTVTKNLYPMVGVIALLAAIVAAISFIPNPEKSLPTVAAISVLLLAMSASMLILGSIKSISKSVYNTLYPMVGVIALLALIIAGLSLIPNPSNLLPTVTALSVLMLAMSGTLVILGAIKGKISNSTIGTMALLGLIVAELGLILAPLSLIPDPMGLVPTATALSVLLLAMSASLVVLDTIRGTINVGTIGAMALLGLVVAEIGAILGIMQVFDIAPSIETATSLSILLLAMSAACAIVSKIPLAGAVTGALGLASFVGIMAGVIAAFGGLTKIPGFNELMADGGEALANVGYAIGNFVGSIVGGLGAGIMSGLPEIGTHLSEFMNNLEPFLNGLERIDNNMMKAVGVLAGAILALTASSIVDGIASFLTGGSSLSSFGSELASFAPNLISFADSLAGFDESKVETVKYAAEAIKQMALAASEIPNEGGWAGKIFGENGIGAFSTQLTTVGGSLRTFVTSLGTFGEDQVSTVKYAADAIVEMAKAAGEIPNDGGWAGKLFGDNSIATFASKLPTVAMNLGLFARSLGTFGDDQVTTIKCAAKAISAMAKAGSEMDGQAGWAAALFGDNSIGAFSTQLPAVGTHMSTFATNLGTFNAASLIAVTCASKAISVMASTLGNITLYGDNGIAAFSENFGTLGTNLNAFVTKLGAFGEDKVTAVKYSVEAVIAMASLANANLSGARKNLGDFGEKLGAFGSNIAAFCSNMPASQTVSSAIANIEKIIKLVKDIAGVDAQVMVDFAKKLNKVGEEGVKAFVKAFTNYEAKSDVKQAAKDLVDQAIKGVEQKEKDLKTAFAKIAKSAADELDDEYDEFYSAGSSLVDGFASGISANSYKAAAQAAAMAASAANAAKKELDINSPSKVFRAIGYSVPEGFAMGIDKLSGMASKSAASMADKTIGTVGDSMTRIAEAISQDIDSQPTIRPVLDLSNVRAGASSIGNMFGASVGLMTNVGAISTGMSRNQNGANGDVVSAINKLSEKLGNVGGASYTINGVTYDDGSNISDAVKSLVRAARVERRI